MLYDIINYIDYFKIIFYDIYHKELLNDFFIDSVKAIYKNCCVIENNCIIRVDDTNVNEIKENLAKIYAEYLTYELAVYSNYDEYTEQVFEQFMQESDDNLYKVAQLVESNVSNDELDAFLKNNLII